MYPESVPSGIPVLHFYLNEVQRTNPNVESKKLPNNGALTLPLAPDVSCRELEGSFGGGAYVAQMRAHSKTVPITVP